MFMFIWFFCLFVFKLECGIYKFWFCVWFFGNGEWYLLIMNIIYIFPFYHLIVIIVRLFISLPYGDVCICIIVCIYLKD